MKMGVSIALVLLAIFIFSFITVGVSAIYCKTTIIDGISTKTNCCDFDTAERDASQQNCETCGHLWGGSTCCDDTYDYFCNIDSGSCVNGISYNNHCQDGALNCDEVLTDCGGSDCQPCCYSDKEDGVCPVSCTVDQDFDCCKEQFSYGGIVPWTDSQRCCETTENWCSGQSSCVFGSFFQNHCTDRIKNCGETGIDCGGECNSCYLISDGICSNVDLQFFWENDLDCCGRIGGIFADGRCCYGNQNWCVQGHGSCVNGVYHQDHCQDSHKNTFCGEYDGPFFSFKPETGLYSSNLLSFFSEEGDDCGGECSPCQQQKGLGETCQNTYDCGDRYCSQNHCCSIGKTWNTTCCANSFGCETS